MHIITRKRLNDFVEATPEIKTALQHWYRLIKSNHFNSFNELKTLFPHADPVGKLTVFNIGGNKVRLIAAIHYNSHKVYSRQITAIKLRKNAIKNNAFSRVFENSITFGQTTFCVVDYGVVALSRD